MKLGAERLRPLFDATGQRFGHLSGQVDPRRAFDAETMLRQGLEIAAQGPNVMVKIPGTTEGLGVLRELSARGIPTNCTSAYIVPQFIAVAENVQAGILEARAKGVDLTRWKSVVTDMSVRWENNPAFAESAGQAGVPLSDEDRRWAGVAVFKEAQRIFRARAYPSKMLICSVRVGPRVDGVQRCWHLEHTAGADAVFTLPPAFLGPFIQECQHLEFRPRIWEDIPADVDGSPAPGALLQRRLRRGRYGRGGLLDIPALRATYDEFSKATEGMVSFVRDRMTWSSRPLGRESLDARGRSASQATPATTRVGRCVPWWSISAVSRRRMSPACWTTPSSTGPLARGPRPRGLREHAAVSASPPTTSCPAGSPSWSASSARSPVSEHIELGAPIAFPYGSTPTKVKLAEAEELIALGATALDMVANIGWLKDRRYELYESECREHIELCHAAGVNGKVIIEAGHLSDEELVAATQDGGRRGSGLREDGHRHRPGGLPRLPPGPPHPRDAARANADTGLKVSGVGTPRVVNAYAYIRMGAQRIGTGAAPEIVDSLAEVQSGLFPALDRGPATDEV